MISNEETTKKLGQRFSADAIKRRKLNPKDERSRMVEYVEGHSVIHRLIDATDNKFDVKVCNVEHRGNLLVAIVEITIPGLGTRQHMGIQQVNERGGEDLAKGVITDAIKKCATLFGVGLELYGEDYEAEDYAPAQARPAARPPQPTPRAANAPHSAPQAPQRPSNVTSLPGTSSGNEQLDAWLSAGKITLKDALDWLGVSSLEVWKADHPGATLAQLKTAIIDARNVALGNLPAEASS